MNIEDKELAQFQRSQRRKDIIKNITIVFLLILLALTFFSRTIMNYTLPEVATHVVAQGEVSPRIRGQGTAEVDDPFTVTMTQARAIKSVAVRVDQTVKRGDVIYYLEDNESDELRTARQELADQQSSFTKRLFDGSLSDSEITRLRSGNYRSDDEMQSALASVNRRLESATKEAAAANKALEKLNASAAASSASTSGNSPDAGDDEEEEGEDIDYSMADDQALEIMKTSSDKKLEKATTRKIDADAELEQAKTEQEKVVSGISAELELKSIQEQINLAQAKVARLEKDNIGATVTSPVDGKVTSLSYTAGETTSADSPAEATRLFSPQSTMVQTLPQKVAASSAKSLILHTKASATARPLSSLSRFGRKKEASAISPRTETMTSISMPAR